MRRLLVPGISPISYSDHSVSYAHARRNQRLWHNPIDGYHNIVVAVGLRMPEWQKKNGERCVVWLECGWKDIGRRISFETRNSTKHYKE